MSAPDPKPDARHVATRDEWEAICDLKDGPCRIGSGSYWVDHAHLVPRAQGGDDIADNIIPLGHEAHMLYHDRGKGWEHVAHMIRASLTHAEKGYVLHKKGYQWLDEHYPSVDIDPLCAKCRKPLRPQKPGGLEKPRPRKTLTIRVPDDAENGSVIFKELVAACGESLSKALGYSGDAPPYYVLAAVMAFYLQHVGSPPPEATS